MPQIHFLVAPGARLELPDAHRDLEVWMAARRKDVLQAQVDSITEGRPPDQTPR